jgi:hypothetical protein
VGGRNSHRRRLDLIARERSGGDRRIIGDNESKIVLIRFALFDPASNSRSPKAFGRGDTSTNLRKSWFHG